MSQPNILELIKDMPVEWKALGSLAILRRGRVMSKSYFIDNAGDYPVYSSQTVNNGMIGRIDTFDFDGEYISWTTDGANAGTVFHRTGKFSITNVCGSIKINDESKLNYKFLFYWLSIEAQKHVYSGMGNPKLMSHQVEKIPVPIPCPDNPKKSLEIQAEIVRILDTFTELTSELTSELNARKKQYNYYRDQLLSFEEGQAEWKTLSEVTDLTRGKRLVKSQLEKQGEYAVYQNSMTPLGYYHEFNVEADTTFVICAGAAGEIGYSGVDFWAADDVHFLAIDRSKLNSKFLFHSLLIQKHKIFSQVRRASIPRLSRTSLERLIIPIPSLEEQARIVAILDKFDTLTTSLSEGLPREIQLRQQQYEYYRDLLLSFPKSATHTANQT